ncbi:hypothetical protein SAMN05660473_00055 [Arthrobacter sp. 49Tsu3.1M3]|uniref:hypothetical protein n=1 Tax=Arthrobacter sp. 49Tsu3.1M3 TaxID=1279029 RepID=UPI0009A5E9B9|nr:hypothetical protein [Arthrobacter sp. 49Tsu3.1M3]SKB31836.1 hypothetical protein SAMN05660473_00055 [Arthrobacter sp. 49Tsu3.1M3]
MGRVAAGGVAALLVLALSACTGGPPAPAQPSPTAAPSAAPVSLETGTDVGNGRPAVSHDGLMVRRRAVIAVHPAPDADLGALRVRLEQAATGGGIVLSGISPDVLEPGILEHLSPDLILALPPGSTSDDAQKLADLAFGPEGSNPGVEHVHVASVLVHDLRFSVAAADPAALARAVAEEGILSDALGNYGTSVDGGALTVTYTGPLLSDSLVESVRNGIARGAGVEPAAVALAPRSATGEGVDMSLEPEPEPEPSAEDGGTHSHDEGGDDPGSGTTATTPGPEQSGH